MIKRCAGATLVLFLFSSMGFSALDLFAVLQKSVLNTIQEPRVMAHVSIKSEIPSQEISGWLDVQSMTKGDLFSMAGRFQSHFRGAELSGLASAKLVNDVLYLSLRKFPMAPREIVGEWFALDTRPFKSYLTRLRGRRRYSALVMLDFAAMFGTFHEEGREIKNGAPLRHFTLSINPNELMEIPFMHVGKEGPPLLRETLKPFNNIPSVPIQFWVGESDNKLYQIKIQIAKLGTYQADFTYPASLASDLFTEEKDAIDARCLGITYPEQLYKILPGKGAFKKRNVEEIPGTEIYLASFDKMKNFSLDGLKNYGWNNYGLDNMEILSLEGAQNVSRKQNPQDQLEEAFQTAKKEFPDKKLEASNRYFILISQSEDGEVHSLVQDNRALLKIPADSYHGDAQVQPWLMRTLGKMYWKFPPSLIPLDLMYGDDAEFDKPWRWHRHEAKDFFVDESAPYLEKAAQDEKEGKLEAEHAALSRAIQLNALNFKAYLSLADLEIRLLRPAEAIDLLDKALLLNPRSEEAYLLLGKAYEKTNRPFTASQEYRAAAFLRRKASP